MPNEGAMAQISRPVQIAFIAIVLIAGVWLFALRGHSSSSEPSPATAPQPAAKAAAQSSTGPTAPGVAGLTKDVEKAKGAVKVSEANAKELEHRSAQASGGTAAAPAGKAAAPTSHAAAPAAKSHTTTAAGAVTTHSSAPASSAASSSGASSGHGLLPAPPRQLAVEAAIRDGNVAMILFWNSKAADDRATHSAMRTLVKSGHRHVVAFQATGQEVATFGAVTRGVQVYGTPTLLVVGKSGQAQVLTGLTDAYAIEQAISEARKP
jgi:hypothetical protein